MFVYPSVFCIGATGEVLVTMSGGQSAQQLVNKLTEGFSVRAQSIIIIIFQSHNFSIVDPMSTFLSLERGLSNDVLKSKTSSEPKFDIFRPRTMGYNPWYHQIGKYFYLSNTKFDEII